MYIKHCVIAIMPQIVMALHLHIYTEKKLFLVNAKIVNLIHFLSCI